MFVVTHFAVCGCIEDDFATKIKLFLFTFALVGQMSWTCCRLLVTFLFTLRFLFSLSPQPRTYLSREKKNTFLLRSIRLLLGVLNTNNFFPFLYICVIWSFIQHIFFCFCFAFFRCDFFLKNRSQTEIRRCTECYLWSTKRCAILYLLVFGVFGEEMALIDTYFVVIQNLYFMLFVFLVLSYDLVCLSIFVSSLYLDTWLPPENEPFFYPFLFTVFILYFFSKKDSLDENLITFRLACCFFLIALPLTQRFHNSNIFFIFGLAGWEWAFGIFFSINFFHTLLLFVQLKNSCFRFSIEWIGTIRINVGISI